MGWAGACFLTACASAPDRVEPAPPPTDGYVAPPASPQGDQYVTSAPLPDATSASLPARTSSCTPRPPPPPASCTVRNDTSQPVSTDDRARDNPTKIAIGPGETKTIAPNPEGTPQVLLLFGPVGTEPSYTGDRLDGKSRNAQLFTCGDREHWFVRYNKAAREYVIDRVPPEGGCEVSRHKDVNQRLEVSWSNAHGHSSDLLGRGEKLTVADHFIVHAETSQLLTRYGMRCAPGERIAITRGISEISFSSGKGRVDPWFTAYWNETDSKLSVRGEDLTVKLPWGERLPPGNGWYDFDLPTVVLRSAPEAAVVGRVTLEIQNSKGDKDSVAIRVRTYPLVERLVAEIEKHPTGRAFPWAAAVTAGPPHPTLLVRRGRMMYETLSGKNCLERIEQAEHIALRDDSDKPVGTCTYQVTGKAVPMSKSRLVQVSKLTVYEAKSGHLVAERSFRGAEPSACPDETTFQFRNTIPLAQDFRGPEPSDEEIDAWLRTL